MGDGGRKANLLVKYYLKPMASIKPYFHDELAWGVSLI